MNAAPAAAAFGVFLAPPVALETHASLVRSSIAVIVVRTDRRRPGKSIKESVKVVAGQVEFQPPKEASSLRKSVLPHWGAASKWRVRNTSSCRVI